MNVSGITGGRPSGDQGSSQNPTNSQTGFDVAHLENLAADGQSARSAALDELGGSLTEERPPASARRVWANRIAAGIVLLIAIRLGTTAYGYGLLVDGQAGPGLFPFGIVTLLGASAFVWLLFARRLSRPEDGTMLGVTEDVAEGDVYLDGVIKAAGTVLLTFVSAAIFTRVGYIITIATYGAGLTSIAQGRVRVRTVVGAFVLAVGSKYMFDTLGVVLPVGVWGGI